MPNTSWSKLNHLQLGRYAEYYAKMEFASYGFEVYASEVDHHGVDFITKQPGEKKVLRGSGEICSRLWIHIYGKIQNA